MTRQFRVGDFVNAKDGDAEKLKAQISEATSGGSLFRVGGHYFFDHELTLVTPVENNRGIEQYKDQFTPWREKSLRDDDPTIRAVANEISIMMEQQT